jgi:hypothetical protein
MDVAIPIRGCGLSAVSARRNERRNVSTGTAAVRIFKRVGRERRLLASDGELKLERAEAPPSAKLTLMFSRIWNAIFDLLRGPLRRDTTKARPQIYRERSRV